MYDQIMVPMDGGEGSANAAFVADRLALRWGAGVTLVSFVHADHRRDERMRLLANLAAPYGDRMEYKVTKQNRTVNEEIVSLFDRAPDQLVVMPSWGRSRTVGVLESQAESVLAVTGAPILLVGPNVALDAEWPGDDHRQVLVTTDGSRAAESAGPAAVDWAQEFGQPLSVVTVVRSRFLHPDRPGKDPNGVDAFAGELDRLGESNATPVIFEGPRPARIVCDLASVRNASLVVVASRGRSGEGRALLGSVSMSIVHHSPAPVLVVGV